MENDKIVSVVAEDGDNRSAQQIERELIEKKDLEDNSRFESEKEEEKVIIIDNTESVEFKKQNPESEKEDKVDVSNLNDESVLNHIRNRFKNETLTFEDLLKEREIKVEVPQDLDEDVAAFNRYKQETGKGLTDFYKSQREVENENEGDLIHDYIKNQNPTFTDDDVKMKMRLDLEYDEDEHDDDQIMERKLKRKEVYGSAVKHFNEEKEKYKAPLEMRSSFVPEEQKESFSRFQQFEKSEDQRFESDTKKKEHFTKTTNELFSEEFEGFEFKVSDDKTLKFKVNNVEETKNYQMKATNFINEQLDDQGMLKDAKSYHKAMYSASNADKIAKFAYEQGRADAIEEDTKASKNIDMSTRKKPENTRSGGLTVTAEESDGSRTRSGNGLNVKFKNY